MGTLYLVRHGQASFGADDYDVLSAMGHQQSVRLGEYFQHRGVTFDAALTGTLNRQIQTLAGICQGMGVEFAIPDGTERREGPPRASSAALGGILRQARDERSSVSEGGRPPTPAGAAEPALPGRRRSAPLGGSALHAVKSVGAHILWPGLNEYDSHAVIETIHPHKLEKPTSPEMYRSHFRLLRDGLAQWMAGVVSPRGMPSYTDFVAGVTSALDHVRKNFDGNVLLVSSGGPIATAVGHVLGTSPETTIELNLRIRNCSVTEFAFTPKRHMLVTYNTLPHLDGPEYASWVTYA
ncbi:histidine phosphatase family protein [Polaromonas sp.]|uniref:histidine phosphatase family protein n=1 Tax=Polaromonas sp. TaxID=1869339 RepID=UPI003524F023